MTSGRVRYRPGAIEEHHRRHIVLLIIFCGGLLSFAYNAFIAVSFASNTQCTKLSVHVDTNAGQLV